MTTTASDLIDVTFAVNAWGQPAAGKWPHFVLKLDGVDIGQATVASSSADRYTFSAQVTAEQAHRLQLWYDNDTATATEDRNLFVSSFEVLDSTGKTLSTVKSIDTNVTYDKAAVDGKDVVPGQTGLYWGGALNVDLAATAFPSATTTPSTGSGGTTPSMTSTITVNAWGASAGGKPPHFKLLVDDQVVGDADVSATSQTAYDFKVDLNPDIAHKVQVWYDNDATVNGQDRNLFVHSIAVDGTEVLATSQYASYDKGAVDGQYVVAGQEGLYWGGALSFGLPEDYFGGTKAPPPPPPAPTPSASAEIVVNASGSSAGGVAPHFKVLVDGVSVGDAKATSGTTTAYTFKTSLNPDVAHKVQVVYDNDGTANGQDRNLFVKSIDVNGHEIKATDSTVTYDKGAVDGKDVVAGQEGMYWGGALNVTVPATDFQHVAQPAPSKPAYYVATNGKDTWSGKLAEPNADGTDGPFASLEKARDAMRADTGIDTTYVREGTYHLSKTFELTSLDNGHTFTNYPNESPVLSGGEKVTGFTSEGNGVYSAKLATATGMDMTIDGERLHMAVKEHFDAAQPFTSDWSFADAASGGASKTAIRYHDGDISPSDLAPGTKIQVFDSQRLEDAILEVAKIDSTTHTITFKTGASFALTEGSTYRLLNNAAFVDQAHEFAWRASDGHVVFKPADGTDMSHADVEVARLGTLVKLNGASHVTVEGLGFTDTTTDGNALLVLGGTANHIGGNHFTNVGTAVSLNNASTYNLVGGNAIDHVAVHGIELEGRSNHNQIYANTIENIGEVRKFAAGIMGTGVDYNTIANNDIDHSSKYGISLKNWSDTTINTGNVITGNHVAHTGQETADTGAIEVLGRSGTDSQTVISNNYVEHVGGLATSADDHWLTAQKGFGVYLDDMAGGVTVKDNFFKDTAWASVMIHGGDNNVVTNNFAETAANNEDFIRVEWAPVHGDAGTPRNNAIDHNIITGTLPLDDYVELLSANNPVIDYNLVYGVPKYGSHDTVADPLFSNPYWGDYHLLAGSPATALGIHDLAWSQMGADHYLATDAAPVFWS